MALCHSCGNLSHGPDVELAKLELDPELELA